MIMEQIVCFIKIFKEQQYAENLLKKGQLHFGVPKDYHTEYEDGRKDIYEGAEWTEDTQIEKIKVVHPILGTYEFNTNDNSPSKAIQYNDYFLLYSLYGITREMLDGVNPFKINPEMLRLGPSAVIIEQPYTFLNSITEKLKNEQIQYRIARVSYDNFKEGRSDLTPFDKKKEHIYQNEFRIIIENKKNVAQIIEIGSIEEYSKLLESQTVIEYEWNFTEKKTTI